MCSIESKFEEIAKEEIKEYNNKNFGKKITCDINSLVCEDQFFGVLEIKSDEDKCCAWLEPPVVLKATNEKKKEEEKIRIEKERKKHSEKIEKSKCNAIVIVLESPHKDEYIFNETQKQYIGPALGTTGQNLLNWLPSVLINYVPTEIDKKTGTAKCIEKHNIKLEKYAIKLVNAVQYQCSLGQDTELFRDKVFSKMWKNPDVRKSFGKRLKESKPCIIINCCTKGDYKQEEDSLRFRVQEEINKLAKDNPCLLLRAAHPSSPHFRNGLSYVEIEKQ